MTIINGNDLDGISIGLNETVTILTSVLVYSPSSAVSCNSNLGALSNFGYVIGDSFGVNVTGNAVLIANNDSGLIDGQNAGIAANGSQCTISNTGEIRSATDGISLNAPGPNPIGATIVNVGRIYGDRYAINEFDGSGCEIDNRGLIEAGVTPIVFTPIGNQTMTIVNEAAGVIATAHPNDFAAIFSQGTGAISLNNAGTINASINCTLANGRDGIINTGKILGDVFFGAGDDFFNGRTGTTGKVFGEDGDDTLLGSTRSDWLDGGADDDFIVPGLGKDRMFGGTGTDRFDFLSIKDSLRGPNRDSILDFKASEQDRIFLAAIDAKKGVAGNNVFKFIGKQDFHDKKGELRYEDKGSKVIVQGDVNGDGKADFEIFVHAGSLAKGDFLL